MVNTNQHIIGLFRASRWRLGSVLADPFGMGLLSDLVDKSVRKAVLKVRKSVFEKMMEEESYRLRNENVIIMKGAKPNETELQTVDKLAKTNEYYVVFPNDVRGIKRKMQKQFLKNALNQLLTKNCRKMESTIPVNSL